MTLLHNLPEGIEIGDMPLNDPFDYLPHEAVVAAAQQTMLHLNTLAQESDTIEEELLRGKMLGVLVVERADGRKGYLRAFSGSIAGESLIKGFVPPIYDLNSKDSYFREEEGRITEINRAIAEAEREPRIEEYNALQKEIEAKIEEAKKRYKESKSERAKRREAAANNPEILSQIERESQHQKGEIVRMERSRKGILTECESHQERVQELKKRRGELSYALQQRLFESYRVVNGRGEWRSLLSIFMERYNRLPPAGAGECAAPKLLHYALTHNYKPLAWGEFWCGESPRGEVRRDGQFYGACHGKCLPILTYMLQGVDVAPVAEELARERLSKGELKILFEDSDIVVFNKPAGMLSVRGNIDAPSVESYVNEHFAEAMMLHRLDQDTSGIMVVAKSAEAHRNLQRQFIERSVSKRYIAIVQGCITSDSGVINLPLRPNPLDRPRQMVDHNTGKSASTQYQVLERYPNNTTRIALYPHTGRTHQLRLHCAHCEGLAAPIIGDRLYGSGVATSPRLKLHAEQISFNHPTSAKRVTFSCEATF